MMVRTPLVPCSMASHSMARSQTCQNGLDHFPATKPKSMAWMPSPTIRFTNRWPKISTIRTTPERRMNSQANISKLECEALFRLYLGDCALFERGDAMELVLMLVPPEEIGEDNGEVTDQERDHRHGPQCKDAPQQLALVLGALLPEVDGNDAQAVEGVEHDCRDKGRFTQAHDGVFVRPNDCCVRLRGNPHQRGVEDVHQQEYKDHYTGNTVSH